MEKDILVDKLQILEARNNSIAEESLKKHEEDELSLNDELQDAGKFTSLFACDHCGDNFQTKDDLKIHAKIMYEKDRLKSLLNEKEKELLEQRLDLMTKIFHLKEMEAKANEDCSCRGQCFITHTKHNWKHLTSDKILKRLSSLKKVEENCMENRDIEVFKLNLHNPWGLMFLN